MADTIIPTTPVGIGTLADLIADVRHYLQANHRETRNKLSGAHDSSTTTFTFTYDIGRIQPGAKVTVGLEECHVWSSNTANKTAIVERGDFGSSAASHADGAIVLVNPAASDFDILRAINAELNDLSSPSNGLFQIGAMEVTYNSAIRGYDLQGVTDIDDILEVTFDTAGSEKSWPVIPRRKWRLSRDMDTDDFSSGIALILSEGAESGRTIRVKYKAPFGTLAALNDDVAATTGLAVTAHDILAVGAAIRMLPGREAERSRSDIQGDSRRPDEVGVGSQLPVIRELLALRQDRIAAEAARLRAHYPQTT